MLKAKLFHVVGSQASLWKQSEYSISLDISYLIASLTHCLTLSSDKMLLTNWCIYVLAFCSIGQPALATNSFSLSSILVPGYRCLYNMAFSFNPFSMNSPNFVRHIIMHYSSIKSASVLALSQNLLGLPFQSKLKSLLGYSKLKDPLSMRILLALPISFAKLRKSFAKPANQDSSLNTLFNTFSYQKGNFSLEIHFQSSFFDKMHLGVMIEVVTLIESKIVPSSLTCMQIDRVSLSLLSQKDVALAKGQGIIGMNLWKRLNRVILLRSSSSKAGLLLTKKAKSKTCTFMSYIFFLKKLGSPLERVMCGKMEKATSQMLSRTTKAFHFLKSLLFLSYSSGIVNYFYLKNCAKGQQMIVVSQFQVQGVSLIPQVLSKAPVSISISPAKPQTSSTLQRGKDQPISQETNSQRKQCVSISLSQAGSKLMLAMRILAILGLIGLKKYPSAFCIAFCMGSIFPTSYLFLRLITATISQLIYSFFSSTILKQTSSSCSARFREGFPAASKQPSFSLEYILAFHLSSELNWTCPLKQIPQLLSLDSSIQRTDLQLLQKVCWRTTFFDYFYYLTGYMSYLLIAYVYTSYSSSISLILALRGINGFSLMACFSVLVTAQLSFGVTFWGSFSGISLCTFFQYFAQTSLICSFSQGDYPALFQPCQVFLVWYLGLALFLCQSSYLLIHYFLCLCQNFF